jgi:hypothetical protein
VPYRGCENIASRAGADEVLLTGEALAQRIRALAPDGVHHIVEVAFEPLITVAGTVRNTATLLEVSVATKGPKPI